MYNAIVILAVIASILMCLIVLVQESKGGGLASSFADNNSMLGVRKTTDVVEKITWSLAAAMVILSVVSVCFLGKAEGTESVMQQTTEQSAANPTNVPGIEQGKTQQQTPAAQTPAEGQQAPAAQTPAPAEQTPAEQPAATK